MVANNVYNREGLAECDLGRELRYAYHANRKDLTGQGHSLVERYRPSETSRLRRALLILKRR